MDGSKIKEIQEITIAALLHDIGRFMERAYAGEPTHFTDKPHPDYKWTYMFFEKVVGDGLLKIPESLDISKIKRIASLCEDHRNQEENEIIKKSDLLYRHDKWRKHGDHLREAKKPLISILSSISIDKRKSKKLAYHKLLPIGYNEEIFPVQNEDLKLSTREYRDLWDKFVDDLQKIDIPDVKIFIGALIAVLKKYTWCVPVSSDDDYRDIPLYDHMLTTSAIASSLYAYRKTEEDKTTGDNKEFLLVSGDLSGIQKFIFDLKQQGEKGVSKILRGRSFYISQMTSAAVHYILDETGLTPVNRIMDAGGRFTLLMPNTDEVKKKIGNCRDRIEEFCLRTFSGELALIIDYNVSFSLDDMKGDKFSYIIGDFMAVETEKAKKRPLSNALKKSSFVMEENYVELADKGACIICGKEPQIGGNYDNYERGKICDFAYKKGQELPGAYYILLEKVYDHPETTDFWGKYHLSVSRSKNFKGDLDKLSYIECINDYGDSVFPVIEISTHVPRYTADNIKKLEENNQIKEDEDPPEPDDIKTFSHIAYESKGIKMLGILKSDLDNMGFIFREGLPKNKITLARTVALSRCVNFFFTYYLSEYLDDKEKYNETYTLFAGGDDLCLIGPWNRMIELSVDIQKEFCKYTGENDDITISSGIHFAKPHYPAGKAISHAEKVLEMSKDRGKNRFTMCGYTAEWGGELNKFLEFGNKLGDEMKKDSPIKSSTLYRFLYYHQEYLSMKDLARGALWLSHLYYDLERNVFSSALIRERIDKVKEFFNPLLESHQDREKLFIEKLPLALFPVIWKRRSN